MHDISLRLLPALIAATAASIPAQSPTASNADAVPLWTTATSVPQSVAQWDAAERARGSAWIGSNFVDVSPGPLLALDTGDTTVLRLDLQGGAVEATFEPWQEMAGHRVFRGRTGDPDDTVLVSVGPTGAVAAAVTLVAADLEYELCYTGVGDLHVLRPLDASRQLGCGNTPAMRIGYPQRPTAPSNNRSANTPTSNTPAAAGTGSGPGTASSSTDTTLDVMVFYTARARSTGGGVAAIEAQIVLRVADASVACEMSGVPARFRLVHQEEIAYAENGSSQDLGRFRSTTDGIMDHVHALRDSHGADLMHLITQPSSLQYCGIAYLMSRNTTGFASASFGVTVRSCLGGRTMTHELGHNISCHHDRNNAGGALYNYSYGYRTPDSRFRTIMSYRPGSRVNRWSSPNVQVNGYTMGVANREDNARSITNTRTTVSRFRSTTVYEWYPIDGGVAGLFGEPRIRGLGTSNLVTPRVELELRNTPTGQPGAVVVGVSRLDMPLLGATLVPDPALTLPVVGTALPNLFDITAIRTLAPGTDLYFQTFFVDPAAAQGISATDALQTTTL